MLLCFSRTLKNTHTHANTHTHVHIHTQVALAHASEVRANASLALRTHGVSTPLVELLNVATVAEITVACALQRKESSGGHFCVDYPDEVCVYVCVRACVWRVCFPSYV